LHFIRDKIRRNRIGEKKDFRLHSYEMMSQRFVECQEGTMMQQTATARTTAIGEAIAGRIGQQKFRVWFGSAARMEIADEKLTIAVPSEFMARWISSHFADEIDDAVESVTGRRLRLSMVIQPDLLLGDVRRRQEPVASQLKEKPVESPRAVARKSHRPKLTLDDFVVGPSNQLAFNAAKAVISSDITTFNPLFVHGGYGVGKTHLLQGICNGLAVARPGAKIMYLSAEDFMNHFVLALKTKRLEEFRARFRQLDLLAIDDIHFIANKNSMQGEFLHTFNSIDLAGKQIVLASDAHPKQIGQLSESLVSRFVSGMVVKVDSPEYQTRLEICRRIAARMKKHIGEDVLEYVAEHVRSNVRELEGAILKLVAFAALGCDGPNVDMARRILDDHITRTDPLVHVSDIEGSVAAFFGVSPGDVHSSKKSRTVAIARSFCMHFIRSSTRMSFPEIGRCMGGKNHATVIMACRKVDGLLERNADVRWDGPGGNRLEKARTIVAQIKDSLAQKQ
jgi:chromosomal replication initiator protein